MNPFNQQVSEALNTRRGALAEQIVTHEFLRHPELDARYGKIGREKCLQDSGYHLSYLAQAISAESPALFENYIGWAKVMLSKRGIPAADLEGLLGSMRASLETELPPDLGGVACAYVDLVIEELPRMPDDIPTFIVDGSPHAPLAGQYLRALLVGKRNVASQLILHAAETGTPVRELYLHVFQRTQYEAGRLWQINEISVAQEHYCSAATQFIMTQLYPYIFGMETKKRGSIVATCVSGDLHEIGVRMVSDFFEMDGWNSHYLGANVPAASVVQTLIEQKATVLAISVTISYHIAAVEALIAAVRRSPECFGVKILVGGFPFKVAPDLWRHVGADGFACDAETAVALANRLTLPAAA